MRFHDFYQTIEEARRWLRPMPMEIFEKYKDDPNIFVSFTDDFRDQLKHRPGVKIGINPRTTYDTPIGIYTYPLKASWETYFTTNNIPYQGDKPNIYVLRAKHPDKLARSDTYYPSDFTKDVERLKEYIPDLTDERVEKTLESIAYAYKQSPIQKLWSLTRELSGKNISKWARMLFHLYDGFVDDLGNYGQGFIHHNERLQAVFFNASVLKVVDIHKRQTRHEWDIRPHRDPKIEVTLQGQFRQWDDLFEKNPHFRVDVTDRLRDSIIVHGDRLKTTKESKLSPARVFADTLLNSDYMTLDFHQFTHDNSMVRELKYAGVNVAKTLEAYGPEWDKRLREHDMLPITRDELKALIDAFKKDVRKEFARWAQQESTDKL